MRFRLLGPVEAQVDDRPVSLGGPKPKTVFALLAANAGRVVGVDRIVDVVWGEEPPDNARSSLYTYVSTLRRALGDVIGKRGGGYQFSAPRDQVDLHIFIQLVEEGRALLADGSPAEAVRRLDVALDLWRGPALADVQGAWGEAERTRLEELRLVTVQDAAEAKLGLDRGESLVVGLTAAVAEHPLRERLRGLLMRALHQAGRQADALACYGEGRAVLLEELGVEPGPELRAAHERVLRSDDGETPAAPLSKRPDQLPFGIGDFTGRGREANRLTRRLREGARLCVISGKPGVGKSALAVHVAHDVGDHFPDGRLFADLGGLQPVRAEPTDVLAKFLRALGVANAAIPDAVEERAQLYRTLLADRRVLVVLDDATDERQVRPLLPGGHRCALLVTSRQRLDALGGASHLGLDVFGDEEAVELLGRVAGVDRVGADREQALRIARLCGNLPLALRIAAARLAARSLWPLRRLADRLMDQRDVLRELRVGDLEVRGSFALSYDGLPVRERVALRRLGLLGVPDFGSWIVAALLDCPVPEAEDTVERLVDAQFVDMSMVGGMVRYHLHDLVRAFARERGEAEESSQDVHAAASRAARSALALTQIAGNRMPHATFVSDRLEAVPHLDERVVEELLADPEQWFVTEQAGLVATTERVSELDLSEDATTLAAALCSSRFAVHNLFGLWWRTHDAALGAARRTGDRAGEARLLTGLGWLRFEQDRFDEAEDYYRRAITAYGQSGDRHGQASVQLALSSVQRERGMLADALVSLTSALPDLDDPSAIAQAVHGIGRVLTERGELGAALDASLRAREAYRRLGDRRAEAIALRSIGIVHRAAGRNAEAEACCAEALDMLRDIGDRLMTAYATQALAKVLIRQGRGAEVRDDLVACLVTCNEMQDGFGQALVLRTLGELELAQGRTEEARHHLERSLRWWEALSLPIFRARTLRDLSALGDDAAWAEALAIFRRHGAREAREGRPQIRSSDLLKVLDPE
ncbi:AfsR/SARP family transcriptional regulator [Lentzea kentuckyensis]|uniref:AfsR/SARP family transcriptional regulator n=1 Tax=Lentzea kentuckyensis TaxID=360086 RepID=UPI000A3855CC|nr:BTAD domain-containing putative transcriptional regulator [Lentzea kentuckyensis]